MLKDMYSPVVHSVTCLLPVLLRYEAFQEHSLTNRVPCHGDSTMMDYIPKNCEPKQILLPEVAFVRLSDTANALGRRMTSPCSSFTKRAI